MMAQEKSNPSRFNFFRRLGERDRVETLLITGNFGRSRLLAELAQEKRKHPILLISPEAGQRDDIYFMPTRPEAFILPESEFLAYVEFLKPKRVVVLGDESFVPARYLDQLRSSSVQTVVLNSKNWNRNAEALAKIINYLALPRIYAGYVTKLELSLGGHYVPSGAPAGPAVPATVPPATMMAPVMVD
jgi:hypothetical protein